MSLAPQINTSKLFDNDFQQLNRQHCNLLIGRTIHFYLQFIEPILLKKYSDCSYRGEDIFKGFSKSGAIDLRKLALNEFFNCEQSFNDAQLLHLPQCLTKFENYLIFSPQVNCKLSNRNVSEAYEYIESKGFGFLLELSFGLIVINKEVSETNSRLFITLPDRKYKKDDLVKILLKEAAKRFIYSWVEAEIFNKKLDNTLAEKFADATSLWVLSIQHEFYFRTGTQRFNIETSYFSKILKQKKVFPYLKAMSENTPLSAEIIACWYPYWNRSLFIFDSPFDHKTSLK